MQGSMSGENVVLPDQITAFLYIGGARLAYMPDVLKQMGIGSVLKLYESPPDWPGGFAVCDMPYPDGQRVSAERMARQIEFVTGEIDAGRAVLVVCRVGMSRSSTAVLAYLVSTGMALPDAYRLLRLRHSVGFPNMVLWDSLVEYFKLPYTRLDLVRWTLKSNWLPLVRAVVCGD